MSDYRAGTAHRALDIIDFKRLEAAAEGVLPKGAFDYIARGAGDEWTMRQNEEAFHHRPLIPRVLSDLDAPDPCTDLLGLTLSMPILMAPTAAQGLCHVDAEKATARGVAEVGTLMAVSTYANTPIEDIARAGGGAPQWFQLYLGKDDGANEALVSKAARLGFKAIVLTADATIGGNREADAIDHFTFPLAMPNLPLPGKDKGRASGIGQIFAASRQKISPRDIERISSWSGGLPVLVKGVQSPMDAMLALGAGASGIYVSNHGGRQLDGGPGSFDVLQSIAEAVDGRAPIVFDSGIRRGQHVFQALACGADAVAVGRPALYGLALGGAPGVASVFRHLEKEFCMVMQLCGTRTVAEIRKARLMDRERGA